MHFSHLRLSKTCLTLLLAIFIFGEINQIQAQSPVHLPKGMTEAEIPLMDAYLRNVQATGIVNSPTSPVRTAAEWEEADALVLAWQSYPNILRQIVQHAKEEVEVVIVTNNPTSVVNYLSGGGVDTSNVTFINENTNSIWIRDFGQWNVYTNEVDSLLLIDWIYNRPRPLDDNVPTYVAELFDLPLYQTLESPNNLVHTGGNFMVDGMGTGFSSNLVLDENDGNGIYNNVDYPDHTEEEIDEIMYDYMGITRFIKMTNLPYDAIHHIDMHMKLIDEETILISEYPTGVADGPQIEENIEYIQNNFVSIFGEPYDIIRIPAPADQDGDYPDQNGYYRTFTNSIFINKTVLVPVYGSSDQEFALDLYREILPGYNIIGINCNQIIPASGALHCITKLVHTDDPLLIVHNPLDDAVDSSNFNAYDLSAFIRHRSDIASATISYRIHADSTYQSLPMTFDDNNNWLAGIPVQLDSTNVQYFIEATSNSGKTMVRPITAPEGYWDFNVYNGLKQFSDTMAIDTMMVDTMQIDTTMVDTMMIDSMIVGISQLEATGLISAIYPNPASQKIVVEIESLFAFDGQISLSDLNGKTYSVFEGEINPGKNKISINAVNFTAGIYFLKVEGGNMADVQKIMIK